MRAGAVRFLAAGLLMAGSGGANAGWGDSGADIRVDGAWALDAAGSDDAASTIRKARESARPERHRGFGHHGPEPGSDGGAPTGTGDRMPPARAGHPHEDILTGLETNPAELSIHAQEQTVSVAALALGIIECEAGGKSAIEDMVGDAVRTCAWHARAWQVKTDWGRAGSRLDQYEVSKDGATLTYTTKVSGGRFPKILLTRVYHRAPMVPTPLSEALPPAKTLLRSSD